MALQVFAETATHPRRNSLTLTSKPYEKGMTLSMLRSVASEAPTLSPSAHILVWAKISIVPRVIFVGMFKACGWG